MRALLILLGLLLLIAACGGSDGNSADAGDDPAASESPTEEVTATRTSKPTIKPTPVRTPSPVPTAKRGTRESPFPLGTVAQDSEWQLAVVSTIPDATGVVAAENQFNDAPQPGMQFFIATIQVTYIGDASKAFGASYSLRAVGPSAVSYSTFENSCGVIPDDFPSSELFPGGSVSGNVCWEVRAEDVGALVMYYEPFLSSSRSYFALY